MHFAQGNFYHLTIDGAAVLQKSYVEVVRVNSKVHQTRHNVCGQTRELALPNGRIFTAFRLDAPFPTRYSAHHGPATDKSLNGKPTVDRQGPGSNYAFARRRHAFVERQNTGSLTNNYSIVEQTYGTISNQQLVHS